MAHMPVIVACLLSYLICSTHGYKGKYYKSDMKDLYKSAMSHNSVNKVGTDKSIVRLLYSMSREIKLLRNQVSAVKQQNHMIYTNLKKGRNTCKPVPENSANPCPVDFVYNPSLRSCYKVVPDKASWPKAIEKCKEKNSKLVSIESSEEQRFLIKQFQTSFDKRHCNYWTSGTDRKNEGTWIWSATGKPLSYTKWNIGEPNNGNVDEHCLHMLWYFKWGWNDARCSVDHSCYVCEIHFD